MITRENIPTNQRRFSFFSPQRHLPPLHIDREGYDYCEQTRKISADGLGIEWVIQIYSLSHTHVINRQNIQHAIHPSDPPLFRLHDAQPADIEVTIPQQSQLIERIDEISIRTVYPPMAIQTTYDAPPIHKHKRRTTNPS